MKLASFFFQNQARYGVVEGHNVQLASETIVKTYPCLTDFLSAHHPDELKAQCKTPVPLDAITWRTPIPNPSKIICAGLNYQKPYPVEGVAPPEPKNVILFSRTRDSLIAHQDTLEYPRGEASETFDFEGEIAVIIGKSGRYIKKSDAMAHVLGVSAMNEGSVRRWMKHSIHAGKNFHASGSWGPYIITSDEAGPFENLRLETRVNGQKMQSARPTEMIFDLPYLISYISTISPLNVGDVIATGSPDGTGGSRRPPAFLRPNDVVEIDIKGLMTLQNVVGV